MKTLVGFTAVTEVPSFTSRNDHQAHQLDVVENALTPRHWLYKTELIKPQRPWKALSDAELAGPHESASDAAGGHPGLSGRVLVRLLRDTDADTAQTEARHPALPVPVMEQMLQRIHLPAGLGPGP